jgi:cytochrome c peroxidase
MRLLTIDRRIRRWMGWLALILVASLLVMLWQRFTIQPVALTTPARLEIAQTNEPLQPIPREIAINKPKVALGERLFQDVRLSKNNQKSCLSCHSFSLGGADRIAHSIGIDGVNTKVNTPTVFNARFNFRFNWDGKFTSLADHLDALMTNPIAMATQWPTAIRSLQQVPAYARAFSQIYPDGITATNIKDALIAYELSLNTPNARFDRFLLGDKTALTATEKEGYRLFKNYGCVIALPLVTRYTNK